MADLLLGTLNNTESTKYKLAQRTPFDKLLQGSVEFWGPEFADGERVVFGLVCGELSGEKTLLPLSPTS